MVIHLACGVQYFTPGCPLPVAYAIRWSTVQAVTGLHRRAIVSCLRPAPIAPVAWRVLSINVDNLQSRSSGLTQSFILRLALGDTRRNPASPRHPITTFSPRDGRRAKGRRRDSRPRPMFGPVHVSIIDQDRRLPGVSGSDLP
jgi:hypothetical protein